MECLREYFVGAEPKRAISLERSASHARVHVCMQQGKEAWQYMYFTWVKWHILLHRSASRGKSRAESLTDADGQRSKSNFYYKSISHAYSPKALTCTITPHSQLPMKYIKPRVPLSALAPRFKTHACSHATAEDGGSRIAAHVHAWCCVLARRAGRSFPSADTVLHCTQCARNGRELMTSYTVGSN